MIISAIVVLLFSTFQAAQPAAPLEMMTYQMVFLRTGPNAGPSAADAQKKLGDEHLARLADLNRKRINLLYGPVTAPGDLRGIAILAVSSSEEATKLFADDPFVKAGVMVTEVRPWMGPKGWFHAPAGYDVTNPAMLEPLVLGFLVRAADAPSVDAARGAEIQQAHLAYMAALNAEGKLVAAGPFGNDGARRGLVIYRVKDVAAAQALAAQDPAVKAGRLTLEAYPWMTFKGILK